MGFESAIEVQKKNFEKNRSLRMSSGSATPTSSYNGCPSSYSRGVPNYTDAEKSAPPQPPRERLPPHSQRSRGRFAKRACTTTILPDALNTAKTWALLIPRRRSDQNRCTNPSNFSPDEMRKKILIQNGDQNDAVAVVSDPRNGVQVLEVAEEGGTAERDRRRAAHGIR